VTAQSTARGPGCFVRTIGGLVFAVGAYGAVVAFDAFVGAPWAYSVAGRATLTGQWSGAFTGSDAPGGTVWLEIIRGSGAKRGGMPQQFDYSRLGGRPLFHGTAVWCRSDGSVSRYTLRGSATRAGDVRSTFTAVPAPTRTMSELNEMHGSWSGADLRLSGTMPVYTVVPSHPASVSYPTKVDTLAMRPAPYGVRDSSCAAASGSH
jgi:hypothetical protein